MHLMVSDRVEEPGGDFHADSPVARLTQGQIDCLLLVDRHYSSKEIATMLGISPHTVDQRIRGALEKLGVERRGDAARLVADRLSPDHPTYQRLIHQSPHIERPVPSGHPKAAVSNQIRHADRAGGAEGAGFRTEQRAVTFAPSLQLPFATRSHPSNEMSIVQRLLWIVLIAMGAAFSAGMYLAGLESLSRLIKA